MNYCKAEIMKKLQKKLHGILSKVVRASLTVEAAYTIPVIICVIFAVMTISFYFYDITTAQVLLTKHITELQNIPIHPCCGEPPYFEYADINKNFLQSMSEDYSGMEEYGAEEIKSDMEKNLILLHVEKISIEMKAKNITATAELQGTQQGIGTEFLVFLKHQKNMKKSISIDSPADFARILSRKDEKGHEK